MLAQQASGYDIGGRNFHIKEKLLRNSAVIAGPPKLARPVLLLLLQEPARPVSQRLVQIGVILYLLISRPI
jgi:hypothetical protein